MADLPLKTSARTLFAWQRRLGMAICLFTLCCVSVWCFVVSQTTAKQVHQTLDLIFKQQPNIAYNPLTELLATNQSIVSISKLSANQSPLQTKKLNDSKMFSWHANSQRFQLNDGQYYQLEYIVLNSEYITLLIMSLGFFWFIALFSIWIFGHLAERKLFALERKARRLQGASRSEINRHESLFIILDKLLEELIWSRQEQSRVDKFIREQAFLDPETGIGNRVFFINRLDALLNIEEQIEQGVVIGIRIADLDNIKLKHNQETASEVVIQFSNIITQSLHRHKSAIFARYAEHDFAIVIDNIAIREIEQLCNHLVRSLAHVRVPKLIDKDNLYHIGVATYKSGDNLTQVLLDVDTAIRTAQLQGPSNWFMYQEEDRVKTMTMGSLQWRTLLEKKLAQNAFIISYQAVMQITPYKLHHQEVLVQIQDNQNKLLPSNLFMPMAHKCGLTSKIDKQVISQLFDQFKQIEKEQRISVNLSLDSLLDKGFKAWFINELNLHLQYAKQLIVEISEQALVNNADEIASFIEQVERLSVRILIDQVGHSVTSSNYIKEHPIHYLKLHPSIVKNIHSRSENQLFVRSLQGTCAGTNIKIFAYGIETEADWQEVKQLNLAGAQGYYFNK